MGYHLNFYLIFCCLYFSINLIISGRQAKNNNLDKETEDEAEDLSNLSNEPPSKIMKATRKSGRKTKPRNNPDFVDNSDFENDNYPPPKNFDIPESRCSSPGLSVTDSRCSSPPLSIFEVEVELVRSINTDRWVSSTNGCNFKILYICQEN